MDKEKAKYILETGAEIYSQGMMREFSKWVQNYPVNSKEGKFVAFYFNQINDSNSSGSSGRLFSIDGALQSKILSNYLND